MSTTRVLVADDDPVMRAAICAVITTDPSLELVGVAANAAEAIGMAGLHHPDVALLDVKMPGGGVRAAEGLRVSCPATRVLALTAYADRTTIMAMVRAGATGYLVKGLSTDRLLQGIHQAALGGGALSAEVAAEVLRALAGKLEEEEAGAGVRQAQIARIRDVLDRSRMRIELQPIVDLNEGRISGVEALLRIRAEPVRTPDVWLAEAAAAGLHLDMEMAALQLALDQLQLMPDGVYLACNLSPDSITAPSVTEALRQAASPGLVVEITEHAAVDDYDRLGTSLRGVRSQGCRLAVDDAGSGFASLRHILRLEPDIIKIDMSLTRGIDHDPNRRALAAAMISLAGEMGASIVAEGIECEPELDTLRDLGVGLGQGNYLGKPMPAGSVDLASPVGALEGRNRARRPLSSLRKKIAHIDLLQTAIVATEARTGQEALQVALDGVCAHTRWPVGHAWVLKPKRLDAMVSSGVWHVDRDPALRAFRQATESFGLRSGPDPASGVLASGRPAFSGQIPGPRGDAASAAGLRACFAFPLAVGGAVIGILEFFSRGQPLPDDSLLDVLATFGAQVASVLVRKNAESEVSRRQLLREQVQELAQLGSWQWEPGAGRVEISGELLRIIGAAPEEPEMETARLLEFVHPEDRRVLTEAIHAAEAGRNGALFNLRVVRPDAAVRILNAKVVQVPGPGEVPLLIGMAQDVTEHRLVEEAMWDQTRRLRIILDNLGEGVVVADAGGRRVEMNPAAVDLLGAGIADVAPEEWAKVYGLFLPDRVTPYPADRLPLVLALEGIALDRAQAFVQPPGASGGRHLSFTGRPMLDEQGRLIGGMVVISQVAREVW